MSRAVRSWPDLVFHVLAHVPVQGGPSLAPSVSDETYVAFAARTLGAADARALGEDARVLARVLASHDALVDAQLVAWLFDDAARAARFVDRDLAALEPADVDRPDVLARLRTSPFVAQAEIVRAAAELERDAHARLPPTHVDHGALEAALARVTRAAPGLADCDVLCVRSLRLRGRVHGREIWIGAPCDELALSIEHVAWQAAHEATVREVSRELRTHDAIEREALRRLCDRARAAGEIDSHARWLAHLGLTSDAL